MRSIWIARDWDGTAWIHFRKPNLQDGVFRDDSQTMVCHLEPEEDLFPEIQKGQCVRFRADIRQKQRLEMLEQFNIVDYCIENHWDYELRSVDLATAFKALHDSYGWNFNEIHDKFKREIDIREDVYIVRTSDIFVRGAERKQYPIYNNQWFSHMLKR